MVHFSQFTVTDQIRCHCCCYGWIFSGSRGKSSSWNTGHFLLKVFNASVCAQCLFLLCPWHGWCCRVCRTVPAVVRLAQQPGVTAGRLNAASPAPHQAALLWSLGPNSDTAAVLVESCSTTGLGVHSTRTESTERSNCSREAKRLWILKDFEEGIISCEAS